MYLCEVSSMVQFGVVRRSQIRRSANNLFPVGWLVNTYLREEIGKHIQHLSAGHSGRLVFRARSVDRKLGFVVLHELVVHQSIQFLVLRPRVEEKGIRPQDRPACTPPTSGATACASPCPSRTGSYRCRRSLEEGRNGPQAGLDPPSPSHRTSLSPGCLPSREGCHELCWCFGSCFRSRWWCEQQWCGAYRPGRSHRALYFPFTCLALWMAS